MPQASSKAPLGSSSDSEIQSESQIFVVSGSQSGSLSKLDEFSLSGSLPDIQSSQNNLIDSPKIVVHRADDGTEMEAQTLGHKRARTPSPHSSSRASSNEKNSKQEKGRADEGPSSKKSSSERSGRSKNKSSSSKGKISLSRTLNHKLEEPSKKVPKSK